MAVSTLIVICTNHITGGDMKVSITDPEEKREERKYSPLSGSLGAAQGQYASVRLTIVAEREIFLSVARWQETPPECLHPDGRGVRGEAGRANPGDECRD